MTGLAPSSCNFLSISHTILLRFSTSISVDCWSISFSSSDAVEIRSALLPIIRVSGNLDVFVRLELDEFERAGADWFAAHIARRNMAGINRRIPGGSKAINDG